jgi:hypothetical protein
MTKEQRNQYQKNYNQSRKEKGWITYSHSVPPEVHEALMIYKMQLMLEYKKKKTAEPITTPLDQERLEKEYLAKLAIEREAAKKPVISIPSFDGQRFHV